MRRRNLDRVGGRRDRHVLDAAAEDEAPDGQLGDGSGRGADDGAQDDAAGADHHAGAAAEPVSDERSKGGADDGAAVQSVSAQTN